MPSTPERTALYRLYDAEFSRRPLRRVSAISHSLLDLGCSRIGSVSHGELW